MGRPCSYAYPLLSGRMANRPFRLLIGRLADAEVCIEPSIPEPPRRLALKLVLSAPLPVKFDD
jgi:hypothetical protein